jgi:hypothetical protein
MILVTGALFLLGIIILSANTTFRENERVVTDSEFGIAAVSLATSLIEEAEGKAFDEACTDSGVTVLSLLTPKAMFGPKGTESYRTTDTTKTDYDDLSDFDGFSIEFVNDTTKPKIAQYRGESKGFRADYFLRAQVDYVNAGNGSADLNNTALTRTWHKKLTVTVTSPSSVDTLTLSTIISYWN